MVLEYDDYVCLTIVITFVDCRVVHAVFQLESHLRQLSGTSVYTAFWLPVQIVISVIQMAQYIKLGHVPFEL